MKIDTFFNAALSRREGIAVTIVTCDDSAVGSNGQVRAATGGRPGQVRRRLNTAFATPPGGANDMFCCRRSSATFGLGHLFKPGSQVQATRLLVGDHISIHTTRYMSDKNRDAIRRHFTTTIQADGFPIARVVRT
jgi:hypothetical protein